MKEKNMNNVAEKLPSLPPLMLLSTLLPRCLVCFAAQNIWTGCRAVSLLRHYYVYFKWHVQLRKDIFVLRSHHFDGFYFVSARLTEYDRAGRRKKVVGRNGSGFDVQMAPSRVFCWENSRFGCDGKSSKRQRGFDKLLVWHGHRVGVGFRSKSSTMVACQIPVSYEMAIQNSMTLGIGEKWFYQDDVIPRGQNTSGYSPLHQTDLMPFSQSQLISNQVLRDISHGEFL